ncbi:MAG: beta-galactosidase [Armatimonadota bacterium]
MFYRLFISIIGVTMYCLTLSTYSSCANDLQLVDPAVIADESRLISPDTQIEKTLRTSKNILRLTTGHEYPWPGVIFPAPGGKWDISAYDYIAVDLRNPGKDTLVVYCRVDSGSMDDLSRTLSRSISIKPGRTGTITVHIERNAPRVKLFGMRYPSVIWNPVDPANITRVGVFLIAPKEDHVFEIIGVRAGGEYQEPEFAKHPERFFPMVDTFGQYIHKDWPGKVHSMKELLANEKSEQKDLKRKPGPNDRNKYGGWLGGPTLNATGYFRTAKHSGKWWLVDPDGRLFFSNGINCVGMKDITPIDDRDNWFQDFPGNDPNLKEFIGTGSQVYGYYTGKNIRTYYFAGANMKRKYGSDWKIESAQRASSRLRSWGMNTIGNWSDQDLYEHRQTPYVGSIHYTTKMLESSLGIWYKFPDVYDPGFNEALSKRLAEEIGHSAGDPWCIGYYVDNEISWGDENSLGIMALGSPADTAAKKVFIDDLKVKYGAIDKLNDAWGTKYTSWDALTNSRETPDPNRAHDDLASFYTKMVEHYFATVKKAVKKVAPNQLYLGCRFAGTNPLAVAASVKYCDVVSYNLYRHSAADFALPVKADVPIIIGEFQFGAQDRGILHPGVIPVGDQRERARAYLEYVRGVLRHPQFVGCHWFQYRDDPLTGRSLDEENFQTGFLDVTDTPYPEMVDAARSVGYDMYKYRMGK